MAEYTYKDVIIDPEDPRVVIGKEYYYCDNPSTCLERANKDDVAHLAVLEKVYLDAIGYFFIDDAYSICIIRKKEPEKKYVPFDLSKEEDRLKLCGLWVKSKRRPDECYSICGVSSHLVFISGLTPGSTPEEFLRDFTFLDGSPCGRPTNGQQMASK